MKYCPYCKSTLIKQQKSHALRYRCQNKTCAYVNWNNPIPVVAVIVEVSSGVVLAHNVKWQKDFYSVISGFLESNESPEACAVRETKEELNLTVEKIDLVGCYEYPANNQIIIAYHVKAFGVIKLNHELDDYRIVPVSELKPWQGGTGRAIKDWIKRREPSDKKVPADAKLISMKRVYQSYNYFSKNLLWFYRVAQRRSMSRYRQICSKTFCYERST